MGRFFKTFLICAFVLGITSCKDKETSLDGPADPEGTMATMTPERSKKFLDETGQEFLQKFNADDQADLLKLIRYFIDTYGDLEMPENWEVEETETVRGPRYLLRGLEQAFGYGNSTRAGATVTTYLYNFDYEDFLGVYTPGNDSWEYAGASSNIVFKFKNEAGQDCEIIAQPTRSTQTGTIEWTENDKDSSGNILSSEETKVEYRAPKSVDLYVNQGNETLVQGKVDVALDMIAETFDFTVSVSAAKATVAFKFTGSHTQVQQASSLAYDGNLLVEELVQATGNHFTDISYIQEIDGRDAKEVCGEMLRDGKVSVSVLNKVRIDATASYSDALYDAIDFDYDSYTYTSKNEAEAACKRACNTLKNSVSAVMRYNNTQTVQAKLIFNTGFEEWSGGWEYQVHPLLYFEEDGSTYEFEDYFEEGFANVQDRWEDLKDAYQTVWDNAKPKTKK